MVNAARDVATGEASERVRNAACCMLNDCACSSSPPLPHSPAAAANYVVCDFYGI